MASEIINKFATAYRASTPGEWTIRVSRHNPDDFFVQAPAIDPSHPYDIEVLGEDDTLYPTRRGDAEFIVAAHNFAPYIIRAFDLLRVVSIKRSDCLTDCVIHYGSPLLDEIDQLLKDLE